MVHSGPVLCCPLESKSRACFLGTAVGQQGDEECHKEGVGAAMGKLCIHPSSVEDAQMQGLEAGARERRNDGQGRQQFL